MADVSITSTPFLISATNNYVLGNGDALVGSSYSLHIEPDGSWSGSIVIKGRARLTNPNIALGTAETARAWRAIPYRKLFLNGSVADDSFDNVALTTASIVIPIIDGLEVALDATVNAGTVTVYGGPILA